MAQLQVWWRAYLPLDLVTDPNQMSRKARYETGRAPTFWGYPPVAGSLRTRWMYVEHPSGNPRRGADPLVEPTMKQVHDDNEVMPRWATHLMLLIEAEVRT